MTAPERTVTMRLHVPWSAEASERLYAACRTQDACGNLALDYLIGHPAEPLRKSTRLAYICRLPGSSVYEIQRWICTW